MAKTEKSSGGRPSRYRAEYAEQARKLCLMGYTDKELGDFFQVTETTINNWKISQPMFFESLKAGKDIADSNVVESLYNRACGMKIKEQKMFYGDDGKPEVFEIDKELPPDPTSIIYWTKNRQSAKWRDKQELSHTVDSSVIDSLREKYENK